MVVDVREGDVLGASSDVATVSVDGPGPAPDRISGLEQVRRRRGHLGPHLAKGRNVVEHPVSSTMTRKDHVIALDLEGMDGRGGQVQLEGLPAGAVVQRHVRPLLGARKEEAFANRVLPNGPNVVAVGNSLDDARPGLAVVLRAIDVGRHVLRPVAGGRHEGLGRVVGRGLQPLDSAETGKVGWGHVLPGLPAVPGQMHEAVVGSGPDGAGVMPRGGHREDGRVVLDAGLVPGDGPTGGLEGGLVRHGQVGADLFPALPPVLRPPETLRRGVHHVGAERRREDGERPLESLAQLPRGVPHGIDRPDLHAAGLPGRAVVRRELAPVASGIEELRIDHVLLDPSALASARLVPVGAVAVARHADGAVVLLPPADVVRIVGRGGEGVHLRRGIELSRPRLPAVEGHVGAPVVGVDHPPVVGGIDPEVVVVAVGNVDGAPVLAAIGGLPELHVHHVDGFPVLRIRVDPRVVEGSLPEIPVGAHEPPALPRIIRNENPAVVGFDDGVDAVGIGPGDRDAHLPPEALGEARAGREVGPRFPAVGGLEEAASGPSGMEEPGTAEDFPEARVEGVGVARIHDQVHGSGLVALVENPLPGVPPIQ